MTPAQIITRAKQHGYTLVDVGRNGNHTGVRLDFEPAAIVNVYDSGTITYQGKFGADLAQKLRGSR